MTALAAAKAIVSWDAGPLPATFDAKVKTATTIYQGGLVAADSTGYAVPAATSTTHYVLGVAQESVANAGASGTLNVTVQTGVFKFVNSAGGDAITITEIGHVVFVVDDQTVAKTDGTGTRSRAGTVVWVDTDGVWVAVNPYGIPTGYATLTGAETMTNKTLTTPTIASFANAGHTHANAAGGGSLAALFTNGGLASFVANDCAITPTSFAHYEINTTAAASTVTLGAAAAEGTVCIFTADGTKNGHTVQYRDATGPTNLTTALTASKRHTVVAISDGTNWHCNAYIAP